MLMGCQDNGGHQTTMPDFQLRDSQTSVDKDRGPTTQDQGAIMDLSPTRDGLTPQDAMVLPPTPDASLDAQPRIPDAAVPSGPNMPSATACFADRAEGDTPSPNYDQFDPQVGRHCSGTNHQEIEGVEKVVFLGDSVTNGTPDDAHPLCIDNDHLFRTLLANWLSEHFDLSKGNLLEWEQWESYSCLYDGHAGLRRSGDFLNCSRWGANNEDFLGEIRLGQFDEETRETVCQDCCAMGQCEDGNRCVRAAATPALDDRCETGDGLLRQCVPDSVTQEKTLFVFTMGGNDVASMTKAGGEFTYDTEEGRAEIEAGYPSVRAMADKAIVHLEEAIRFMTDPNRFPNGSYVVVGGPFEFTDGTGQVDSCQPQAIEIPFVGQLDLSVFALDVAGLVGFTRWANPRAQQEIISHFLEQYMRIVVEYQVDYVWVLEHFCGHGYVAAGREPDVENRCYRPDDPTLWFDASCTHPNDAGHQALFQLFRDVIAE